MQFSPENQFFDNKNSAKRTEAMAYQQTLLLVGEAENLFADKPFAEANKAAFQWAKVGAVFFQIISICLSLNFGVDILSDLFPPFFQNAYLLSFISLLILGCIELAKRYSLREVVVSYFKNSLNPLAVAGFILLFAISVYAAVEGSVEYTKQQSDKSHAILANKKSNISKIAKSYDSEIEQAQDDLRAYKNSVSWQGKIDASNKKSMAIIATKEASIAKLKTAKEAEKADERKDTDMILEKNNENVETKSVKIFCFSLFTEFVSFGCILFMYYVLGFTQIDNKINGDPAQRAAIAEKAARKRAEEQAQIDREYEARKATTLLEKERAAEAEAEKKHLRQLLIDNELIAQQARDEASRIAKEAEEARKAEAEEARRSAQEAKDEAERAREEARKSIEIERIAWELEREKIEATQRDLDKKQGDVNERESKMYATLLQQLKDQLKELTSNVPIVNDTSTIVNDTSTIVNDAIPIVNDTSTIVNDSKPIQYDFEYQNKRVGRNRKAMRFQKPSLNQSRTTITGFAPQMQIIDVVEVGEVAQCSHCNNSFEKNNGRHEYCSAKCRLGAWTPRRKRKLSVI